MLFKLFLYFCLSFKLSITSIFFQNFVETVSIFGVKQCCPFCLLSKDLLERHYIFERAPTPNNSRVFRKCQIGEHLFLFGHRLICAAIMDYEEHVSFFAHFSNVFKKNSFSESFIGSLEFAHQPKGSTRNTCSESLRVHFWFKYASLYTHVGQTRITQSKNPKYSGSSKLRTKSVLPHPVAPQIIAEWSNLGIHFFF